ARAGRAAVSISAKINSAASNFFPVIFSSSFFLRFPFTMLDGPEAKKFHESENQCKKFVEETALWMPKSVFPLSSSSIGASPLHADIACFG
ncbi:MAG: hypothetical protein IKP72_13665, partial [Clostridia bacterium]|nr:hypothetical protein [Clostridia bacterium]